MSTPAMSMQAMSIPAQHVPTRTVRGETAPALDAPALAEAVFGRHLDAAEQAELQRFWRTDWSVNRLALDRAPDRSLAATALAFGTPVFHGLGAGYTLTFHPDREVARAVALALHRPEGFAPALITTRAHLAGLLDADALSVPVAELEAGLDGRLAHGPVALSLPVLDVARHLTTRVDGVATADVVLPGTGCPADAFLADALERAGTTHLATTVPATTTPSGRTGPGADRIAAIQREFGRMRPGAVMLAHRSEWWARRRWTRLTDVGEAP